MAEGATLVLANRLPADAPRNLRLMFNRAVETKETAPQTSNRKGCRRMYNAGAGELVAELILHPHACGPDCLCWTLRKVPAIDEILQRLGVPKYQTINEAIEDMVQKLQAQKSRTATKAG